MNVYTKLDARILEQIGIGNVFLGEIADALSLYRLSRQSPEQRIGARLQALKRAGKITFDNASGWQLTETENAE